MCYVFTALFVHCSLCYLFTVFEFKTERKKKKKTEYAIVEFFISFATHGNDVAAPYTQYNHCNSPSP